MTSLPPLCLTGASGFVGRHLLQRLVALGATDVSLLVRDPARLAPGTSHPAWRVSAVDLASGAVPEGSIQTGAVVLHLAAATGNAGAREMNRVNVGGTQALLQAAKAARARHFVLVSSIAAGYSDRRWAPYADSKLAAERLVAQGGMSYTLVRPTMVFGPGSPNQRALQRLATLALPVLPGQGDVRVQPIHVDDLVMALLHIATEPAFGRVVVAGGPTALSIRDLFAAMRQALGLPARPPISLPLGALRRVLAVAGALTAGKLPVNAGQFLAFANDSAVPAPGEGGLPAPRVSLEAMLRVQETRA